jgi:hypothetical protein
MASQAQEIRDLLDTNWALTGDLDNEPSDSMQEIVRFFDRKQVEGQHVTKAVVVEKINDETDENKKTHPHFTEIRDKYTITCLWRVTDVETQYDASLTNVEDMAKEVQRILLTSYDPFAGNGIFYVVDREWSKDDYLDEAQPELKRSMTFTLTKIASENPQVFEGYMGVLRISGGKIYTEAYNMQSVYGTPQISEPIVGNGKIPIFFTGIFAGRFNADMWLNAEDIGAAGSDINHIGSDLTNGEVSENIFLQQYTNTESPPKVVTISHTLKIINFEVIGFVEDLVALKMIAEIITHPTMVVA